MRGYLTFASLEEAKSAPGQITYEAMENFYYKFQETLDH
nr:hypothetical protein [Coxiella-like endosymbiont]